MQQNTARRVAMRKVVSDSKSVTVITTATPKDKIVFKHIKRLPGTAITQPQSSNSDHVSLRSTISLLISSVFIYPDAINLLLYLAFVLIWGNISIQWSPFTHHSEQRYICIMTYMWPFSRIEVSKVDLNVIPIHGIDVIDKYVDWEPVGNTWAMEMKDGFAIAGLVCAIVAHLLS